MDTILCSSKGRALLLGSVLVLSTTSFAQCVVPSYSCARTDTSVIPLPSTLPNWGGLVGANTVFTDPAFNSQYPSQYARVTDSTSASSANDPHSSMGVGASGDDRHWNADDSLFWIGDSDAFLYVYGLNQGTMATGSVWYSGDTSHGGLSSGVYTAAAWSQSNRNYLYPVTPGGKIMRYNFTGCVLGGAICSPTSTVVFDFVANCGVNAGNGLTADAGVGGTTVAPDRVFAASYGPQDYGQQAVAFNAATNTCYFYNTHFGTIHSYTGTQTPNTGSVTCNGTTTVTGSFGAGAVNWVGLNFTIVSGSGSKIYAVASGSSSSLTLGASATCASGSTYSIEPGTLVGTVTTSDRYSIHDVRLDPSGIWLIVEQGVNCYSSTCQVIHAWKIGTTTVNVAYYEPSACPGASCDPGAAEAHYTETASGWINGDSWYDAGYPGATPYRPSMLYRTWANLGVLTPSGTVELTTLDVSTDPSYDNHPSTKNDPYGTNTYPVFSNTWAPHDPNTSLYPYSNEVDAWPQNARGPLMRFGHTYDSATSPGSDLNNGAPSSTGRFYLFGTDGMGTLGNVNGTSGTCSLTAGTCRTDVFIINLTPPAS